MTSPALCKYLEWDSAFFKRRIARIEANSVTPDSLKEIRAWTVQNQVDCLYFFCDVTERASIYLAEQSGFHLMDLRMTFSTTLDTSVEAVPEIRSWTETDIPRLKAIARVSHGDSRFYSDPNFPNASCDLLYETWVEKSCHGYADEVLVAVRNDEPVGYLTCHLKPDGHGQLGLLAVSASATGQGWGTKLLRASFHWFRQQNRRHIMLVTQGGNLRAQKLYERTNFSLRQLQYTYHWWRSDCP